MSRRYTMKEVQEIAEVKGGKCLSNEYKSKHSSLNWSCAKGHQWAASFHSIQRRSWCPTCARGQGAIRRRRYTLQDLQTVAKRKKGTCLSTEYVSSRKKYLWVCEQEHTWEASFQDIKKGHWCSVCSGSARHSIEFMKQLALDRGGLCLSDNYLNNKSALLWQCANGHTFKKIYNSITSGQWCPYCKYTTEDKCRFALTQLTGYSFNKDRKLIKGYEIDGYSPVLKLGFEYHGSQHYHADNVFIKNKKQYMRNIKRDQTVRNFFMSNGLNLIEIPYFEINNSDERLVQYLVVCLTSIDIPVKNQTVNFATFYTSIPEYQRKYIEYQRLAETKGGKLISTEYRGAQVPHLWECKEGHQWPAKPNTISNNHWCPQCYGNTRKSLFHMQELARSKGGHCLSTEYKGMNVPHEWECKKGHRWFTRPASIAHSNTWCRTCWYEELRKNKNNTDGRFTKRESNYLE